MAAMTEFYRCSKRRKVTPLVATRDRRTKLGIIVRVKRRFVVRKRHQTSLLDFDYGLLRTRRSGVRIPQCTTYLPSRGLQLRLYFNWQKK